MQCIRKALFFICLSTASTVSTFAQQGQEDSLTLIVSAMAKSNIYEASYTVGFTGTVSKQFQRFEQLTALATDEQLLTLATYHRNAVVRLYALQALKKRKHAVPEPLQRQFRNDKAVVRVLKGCIADEKPLNELFEQNLKSPFDVSD
jgi:hypothetical protein